MARTPTKTTPPAAEPTLNETALATLEAAPRQLAVAHEAMDEVLAAGIDLGRLEAMDFVATVANSAILAIYENVKKSKAWRLLRNPKSGDGRQFESLDEFCEVKLGKSYKRMRELALNRNILGEEAFEQAERLGLHQRDYNAIKALPAPDQELVRRAVEEATTREQVLDVLHDLAARTVQREAALQNELQDARDQAEELAASKKVVEGTVADLRKQARRLAQATPDEVAADLRGQVLEVMKTIEADLRGPLADGLEQLMTHGEETGHGQLAWVKGQLEAVLERLKTVAGRVGVELVADSGKPAWLAGASIPGVTTEAVQ
ncbi:hypothetical protein [Acidovorax kalamii]|uniref:hypothetical protein n=1 Tax=Acidovorax kalamii TaxID=2004485 RepID=UPI002091B679|nr:hypothetical protein [Acidovorax kalamii]MCO5354215.1 hypothetical protein [Acidovorax kalamii]